MPEELKISAVAVVVRKNKLAIIRKIKRKIKKNLKRKTGFIESSTVFLYPVVGSYSAFKHVFSITKFFYIQ